MAVVVLRYCTWIVGVPFAMTVSMTKRPELFVETLVIPQVLPGHYLVAVLVPSGWTTLVVRPISPVLLAIAATEVGAEITAVIQRTSECAVANIEKCFPLRETNSQATSNSSLRCFHSLL